MAVPRQPTPMLFSARRFIRRCLDGSIFKGKNVIGQLGATIGIPELALEGGSCTLAIDDVWVTLELDATHNRLVVSSALGNTDDSRAARLYRSLLEGTLEGIVDATGMVFAIDPAQDRIVMATALFLDDLNGDDVAAALSRFVARAETWRARLAATPVASAAVKAPLLLSPTMFV